MILDQNFYDEEVQNFTYLGMSSTIFKTTDDHGSRLTENAIMGSEIIGQKMFGLHGQITPGQEDSLQTTGGLVYYEYDGIGTVTSLRDRHGDEIESYDFDAFGNLISGITAPYNLKGYTGQIFDEKADLTYMNARWYDSSAGRFISEDTWYGSSMTPVSLNRYTYVMNDPINYTDPTGHSPSVGTTKDSDGRTLSTYNLISHTSSSTSWFETYEEISDRYINHYESKIVEDTWNYLYTEFYYKEVTTETEGFDDMGFPITETTTSIVPDGYSNSNVTFDETTISNRIRRESAIEVSERRQEELSENYSIDGIIEEVNTIITTVTNNDKLIYSELNGERLDESNYRANNTSTDKNIVKYFLGNRDSLTVKIPIVESHLSQAQIKDSYTPFPSDNMMGRKESIINNNVSNVIGKSYYERFLENADRSLGNDYYWGIAVNSVYEHYVISVDNPVTKEAFVNYYGPEWEEEYNKKNITDRIFDVGKVTGESILFLLTISLVTDMLIGNATTSYNSFNYDAISDEGTSETIKWGSDTAVRIDNIDDITKYGTKLGVNDQLFLTSEDALAGLDFTNVADLAKAEEILGLPSGRLANSSGTVLTEINVKNIEYSLPTTGNEFFIPGGITSGGAPEIVVKSLNIFNDPSVQSIRFFWIK